jgi:hypothetical protein
MTIACLEVDFRLPHANGADLIRTSSRVENRKQALEP